MEKIKFSKRANFIKIKNGSFDLKNQMLILKEVMYETITNILVLTVPANAISMAKLDKIGLQKLYKIIQPRIFFMFN